MQLVCNVQQYLIVHFKVHVKDTTTSHQSPVKINLGSSGYGDGAHCDPDR